ncbi:hypothetical protein ABT330_33670 [Streptomyces sp. NPDC000658]|uniref:hypothetical protein n=1 Tax=Streptomyces sp. NPDC000658 TaxID=3154266 RepID=UPI0033260A2B
MTSPAAGNLYSRYMAARAVHSDHRAACAQCTDNSRCPVGKRLYDSFARLQDAYLTRQHQQRR